MPMDGHQKNSRPETSPERVDMVLDVTTSQRLTRTTATNETVVPWLGHDRILQKKRKRPEMEEEATSNDMALIIRDDELPDKTPLSGKADVTILEQFIAANANQQYKVRINQANQPVSIAAENNLDRDNDHHNAGQSTDSPV
jgi:hypothetical protein